MQQAMSKPTQIWFWWAYVWLSLVASILSHLRFGAMSPSKLAIDAFLAIGFVPLYGYLRQAPIAGAVVWRCYFVLSVVAFVGQLSWGLFGLGEEAFRELATTLFVVALGLLLSAPMFWATFAYGFRSPHLWQLQGLHG